MLNNLIALLSHPWPWWVAGPLIGLFSPVLLLVGNRLLGISSNLRHMCAIVAPSRLTFFRYDWRKEGAWNLTFVAGILIGGVIAANFLAGNADVAISQATHRSLAAIGITDTSGLVPRQILSWSALGTLRGTLIVVGGGFLVGFGTAYAGGCTSGHAISGLADLQLPSLVAVIGFFAGGLLCTWFLLPFLLTL